jgi:hypothetical protein
LGCKIAEENSDAYCTEHVADCSEDWFVNYVKDILKDEEKKLPTRVKCFNKECKKYILREKIKEKLDGELFKELKNFLLKNSIESNEFCKDIKINSNYINNIKPKTMFYYYYYYFFLFKFFLIINVVQGK